MPAGVMTLQFNIKKKRRVTINITSLIDVLFLLLIFFMVTSSFLEQPGMKLELPSAKSAEAARLEKLIGLDSLERVMAEAVQRVEEKTLVLKADRTVRHGTVVTVMDIAKRVGLEKLVVGTRIDDK